MSSLEHDVSVFVWIFQFCCLLTPISQNGNLLKNISFVFWFYAHLSLGILELTFIYIYQNETFHNGSNIGKILDIVQVILPISAHILLIIETIFNWNIQCEMWECMKTVEKRTKLIGVERRSFLKIYLIEISVLTFVGMVTEVVIVTLISDNKSFLRSWYFRLWSLYMLRFGLMQLIFYVNWIGCQLEMISKGVINVEHDKCAVKLKELKNLHSKVWLISVRFNKRFSWAILVLMIHLFITMIITFYWIVARLYFRVYGALLASSLICISPITNLLVLLYSCQQCVTQANYIGHSLHKSAAGKTNLNEDRSAQFLVRNFSLQIKLLPISIRGWGFFQMDFPFLVDVFSACASYLLLIFSLNPGSY